MKRLLAPNIGIAVYNEEKAIKKSVSSLIEGLDQLKFIGTPKIYVCLNDCSDKSREILDSLKADSRYPLMILDSKKGKLRAHKKIIDSIKNRNPVIFMDADILLNSKAIFLVLKYLEDNPRVMVVSGYPYILKPKNLDRYKKFLFSVLNIKRIYPEIEISKHNVDKFHPNANSSFELKSRVYFHGRFFAVRNKGVYTFPRKGSKIVGDDTFLSREILNKYGPGSIKIIYEAAVYSYPQLSLSEYLKTQYRIRKDVDMIYREYPIFRNYSKYFQTKINWKFVFTKLKLKEQINAFLFYVIRAIDFFSYNVLKSRIKLEKIWAYKNKEFYTDKMNIAIHNAQLSYYMGGTERLIYDHIKNLLECGVSITLVTSKTKKPSKIYKDIKKLNSCNLSILEFNGIESLNIKNPYSSNNPNRWHLESLIFGLETSKFYKENKFDLVITHFLTDSFFIPKNQKNVTHLNGAPLEYSILDDFSLNRPDFFICLSDYVRRNWIKIYPKLTYKNLKVIYPGIDTKKFRELSQEKKIDIIFVGRFIPIKGINYLIEAINLINKKIKIMLVGNGPERENIKKKINKLGLGDKIIMKNEVDDKELVRLYSSAKIAVFPSYAKEGLVLSMLEAASCGCAIITSDACAMPEFIKDRINGILTEPRNAESLAAGINSLLENENLRKMLINNSKNDIIRYWNNKNRIKEIYDDYCLMEAIKNG